MPFDRLKAQRALARMKSDFPPGRFWSWTPLDGPLDADAGRFWLRALMTPSDDPKDLASRMARASFLDDTPEPDDVISALSSIADKSDSVRESRIVGRTTHKATRVLAALYDDETIVEIISGLAQERGARDPLVLSLVAGYGLHLHPELGISGGPELRAHIGLEASTATGQVWSWRPERIWCSLAADGHHRLAEIEDALRLSSHAAWGGHQLEALGLESSLEVADVALRLVTAQTKLTGKARAWLFAHPEVAEPVLRDAAAGGKGSGSAKRLLTSLRARHPDRFEVGTKPAWMPEGPLGEALRGVKPGRMPKWLHPADVVPMLVHGEPLDSDDTARVITALKKSSLEEPHALIPPLVEACGNEHQFAWSVFETWLESGAPSADGWVIWTLGLFGNDLTALKLAPLMKRWPRESQNTRAVKGLAVLQRIGTDNALATLAEVARTAKTASLKRHANEALAAIAADRGLSTDQLEDRVVPDCGLASSGVSTIDYGTRSWRIVFKPDLKLALRDADGELLTGPPRKKKGVDDAAKVAEEKERWKTLKRVLTDTLKRQRRRLKTALVEGRAWTVDDFGEILLGHPVLRELVRRLVWTVDGAGTFRVAEDGSYADVEDEELELPYEGLVRLSHPAELPADAVEAWLEVLSDYEVIPPIEQLDRRHKRLDSTEASGTKLVLPAGSREPFMAANILTSGGWTREYWGGDWAREFSAMGGWRGQLIGDPFEGELPTAITFHAFEGAAPSQLSLVPRRVVSEAWRSVIGALG
ncbi:MAG: DUF4132 domain-containing protein [Proteobacteria bacterium]|nr:DUF4132 domain-containing protein [Pseudomonadota bacterium]MCP4916770.1 DUF4132 domain-containing protein [Pseudomonadota bacterium]